MITQKQPLMARQPIFDLKLNVVAYELLFRQFSENEANVIDGDNATSELLVNAFTELNIDEVVGDHRAFINFTKTLIGKPPPFDKEKFVIEVLEDVPIDRELVDQLSNLKKMGYVLALDDFIHTPAADMILPLADIVKIDVLQLNDSELEEHVQLLSSYDLTLLAEKVETHEMYRRCEALGFELFQGYFFSKPELISGRKVPASKLLVLELLGKLQDPSTEIDGLETLVSRDPVLSFKILKLVNSASYAPRRKIESITRAITYLGLDMIRSLASLLALSNLSDKPNALKDQSVIRAKMCELIGAKITRTEGPIYFSVGLLSTLDAYFDQPMAELIHKLSLHQKVVDALLYQQGVYGEVLQAVIGLEQARFDQINLPALEQYGISIEVLNQVQLDSITWYEASAL